MQIEPTDTPADIAHNLYAYLLMLDKAISDDLDGDAALGMHLGLSSAANAAQALADRLDAPATA